MSINSNYNFNAEAISLKPSTLLNLMELDTTTTIKDPYNQLSTIKYFFHNYYIRPEDSNSTNQDEKNRGALVFQNVNYYYYPFAMEGFEQNSDGSLPRPTLRISNVFPEIKDLLISLGDLVGATVKRSRVFHRYLDNMPDVVSDPSGQPDAIIDTYLISRKKQENKVFVEFELVTPIEAYNLQIPRRQIFQNFCTWKYRGDGCGFTRPMVVDKNDKYWGIADNLGGNQSLNTPTEWISGVTYNGPSTNFAGDVVFIIINGIKYYYLCKQTHIASSRNRGKSEYWIQDFCNKTLKSCRLRWEALGSGTQIPFGGFPCTNRR